MSKTPNVLIVDDEPNILISLQFLMKKSGYEVRTAKDGEEALAEIVRAAPDLVLLDVMMPKIDGFSVCERIRANPEWKDVRIIMLTARGRDVEREKGPRPWRRRLHHQAVLDEGRDRACRGGTRSLRKGGRTVRRIEVFMPAPSRTRELLVALFLLGVLLLAPPILIVFNTANRILGVPTLYLYLFSVWAVLIALVALAVERAADDLAEADTDMTGKESGEPAGGPPDA